MWTEHALPPVVPSPQSAQKKPGGGTTEGRFNKGDKKSSPGKEAEIFFDGFAARKKNNSSQMVGRHNRANLQKRFSETKNSVFSKKKFFLCFSKPKKCTGGFAAI